MTARGLVGDRACTRLIDTEAGKVVSGKTPRLGPNLLGCRAALSRPPGRASSTHPCASRFRTVLRSGATLPMPTPASRASWDAP